MRWLLKATSLFLLYFWKKICFFSKITLLLHSLVEEQLITNIKTSIKRHEKNISAFAKKKKK